MLDFVATKEKALRTAKGYGLKTTGEFKLKHIIFSDKKNHSSVFWTLRYPGGAVLISIYGDFKVVEGRQIEEIKDVNLGEKYSLYGNYFKVTTDKDGKSNALTPTNFNG